MISNSGEMIDKNIIYIGSSRLDSGQEAASDIRNCIKLLLKQKDSIRMVFAAAPSQIEVLEALVSHNDIEWGRIEAFHMDEYEGLDVDNQQSFARFLSDHLFNKVSFKSVNLMNGKNPNEDKRYSLVIGNKPIDIVCLGIGENGHIAFNDPPVADFNDPKVVKKVMLDHTCRQQQVNDGCFGSIEQVPKYAFTLTIPTMMSASFLFCVVPGSTKKEAVFQTLRNPEITTEWPATVLRNHGHCRFYFDKESAERL